MQTLEQPRAVHGTDSVDRNRRIRAIVGAASGHVVEWYDFFVYASFAIYFSGQFFPSGDETTQLLNSMAVFSAGFLVRPLGGWIFGRIADRNGRRPAMLTAMALMALGSFMMALTPTYASIGVWATVFLTLARMVQGVSVGGEYGSVATYMSEVALPGKRGFYSSFQYVTLIGGQLLGLVVLGVLQQFLNEDQLRSFGWRIPFVIGGFAAIAAAFVRSRLQETTTADVRKKKEAGSMLGLMTVHWKPALVVAGFTAGGSLAYYTYATYMQTYLVNTAGLPKTTVTYVMTAALFVFMCVQPLFGSLSDKIGRRNSMRLFALLTGIFTIPILTYAAKAPSALAAFGAATAALLIISFYTSISGLVKAELFPAQLRALGVGFPYAVANALIGGTAPAVALKFKQVGHEAWFYYYVTAWMAVTFLVTLGMPDAREKGYLQGASEVN